MKRDTERPSLGYAIGRTNWYLKTLINKFLKEDGFSISNEQWIVLKIIAENPDVSQTEIAEKSLKDKTNITRMLVLLQKKEYIERRRDDRDNRVYRVNITEKGKKVLSAVYPLALKSDEICMRNFGKTKSEELICSLDAICKSIKEEL